MPNIEPRPITTELQDSYLSYAMSVIIARALPDVRDGLKPVQRRILWAMWDSGLVNSAKFKKCANVVGETLGRYHPHGDSAVYDALVRMAQDFSLRYPLVLGQGNFGSVDGDPPAAMRYTESKLAKISNEILGDIDQETVNWSPNYDSTREEPTVLPAKLPNLILNGTVGIAVGMATNMPPHNLREVVDAILYLADHPECTSEDLLKFIQGPDFPTGGIIYDAQAVQAAYSTGRGGITTRAKAEIEERKTNQYDIVVTEIPYQVNKAELIKKIAELVTDKRIEGIRNLRDESDREGMRIVIELKNDAAPQKVLNHLYKLTDLEKDFHLNMIALVPGASSGEDKNDPEITGLQPQLLSLKEILAAYLTHREEVVRRRTAFLLKKAEERAHILEGLVTALSVIDKIIETIKKSKDREDAHHNLMARFKLSALQSTAILEMRLQALAALERIKVETELAEKKKLIKELQAILKSPARILGIIKDEIAELKEKYGDDRRTQVVKSALGEMKDEDLVPEEETIITLSAGGYVKRLPPDTFKSQKRGGKGLIGSEVAEEDFLTHFFACNTHDNLLFFTDRGRVFQTRAYEIPAGSRTAKGKAVHNFLDLPAEEHITAIVNYPYQQKKSGDGFLLMATGNGTIKKTALEDFRNIRRNGIIAITLDKGDRLIGTRLVTGKDQIILSTQGGQAIRFSETDVRAMGRSAAGVNGIRLKKGDKVAGFDIIPGSDKERSKDSRVLAVMANGYAKQTPLKEYKIQRRGGSGIRTAQVTSKTGPIIATRILSEETEILALSAKGQVIRTELSSVRTAGRATQGVRIMNLKPGDHLAGIAVI